ncbi:TetR/AcrR family transcriptional regulator [Allokutzneria sp. A3M-2-11 16]|uniref:TetR/AcrR family transcriptional regulator n=1 Tax=Allokutzneria sp. A3M-2-11 16 TaxID=2962043 RepID=UPI0020B6AA4A|nr:TetR/AcrR family transcriptional regulator [Allokutzneria sp. A3M-2-11 16]MCP3800239.1 TetR/AcrR family transcriptional regulator [Allokutzneria sp. A3M-2-11 16]
MGVEERRSMIVHAVLPLLVEHGPAVTTSQIARAAGIGEGTIFRAFKDKEELFDACTVEALRPDHVLDAIAEIPLDQPLEQRLTEAAEALGAHLERMSALMAALHPTGKGRRSPMKLGRRESLTAMREAVTELFTPDQAHLRLPADQLASLFLALLFSGRRLSLDDGLGAHEIIDVLLHGALGDT